MQTGTGLLVFGGGGSDISFRNMFYSSDVLVGKLFLCSFKREKCKNEYFMKPDLQEQITLSKLSSFHGITSRMLSFFPLLLFCCRNKLDLPLNVNTACGRRRVCVLFSTPRSQQTWTVPTAVGQTAGGYPDTLACRSMWASITQAVSAVYLTMKRPVMPALKWVRCQRENTGNYWTVSNVDNGCQMLAQR